jgi:hypothetical protein
MLDFILQGMSTYLYLKENKPYVGPAKDTILLWKLVLMSYLDNILFAILLAVGFGYFLSVLKN